MSKPPKHLDIPKQHLIGDLHFVPPKARSTDEKERRHGRLPGALLAEYENRGTLIADYLVKQVHETDDILFVAHAVVPAAINNIWYRKAQHSSRMRKVARLPYVAIGEDDLRPSAHDIHEQAKDGFTHAVVATHGLVKAYELHARDIQAHKERVGTVLGDAALMLATVEIGDAVRGMLPYVAQSVVREQGLAMLGLSRSLGAEIGSHPSLAQLADADSDLSVHIRRNAPDTVYEAYDAALSMYAMPR